MFHFWTAGAAKRRVSARVESLARGSGGFAGKVAREMVLQSLRPWKAHGLQRYCTSGQRRHREWNWARATRLFHGEGKGNVSRIEAMRDSLLPPGCTDRRG